ncbi:hypothetical protein HN011_008781 [Eciton burchellii]|nr:hypothetical protein HN011_008781 [Eciton burchellii]
MIRTSRASRGKRSRRKGKYEKSKGDTGRGVPLHLVSQLGRSHQRDHRERTSVRLPCGSTLRRDLPWFAVCGCTRHPSSFWSFCFPPRCDAPSGWLHQAVRIIPDGTLGGRYANLLRAN